MRSTGSSAGNTRGLIEASPRGSTSKPQSLPREYPRPHEAESAVHYGQDSPCRLQGETRASLKLRATKRLSTPRGGLPRGIPRPHLKGTPASGNLDPARGVFRGNTRVRSGYISHHRQRWGVFRGNTAGSLKRTVTAARAGSFPSLRGEYRGLIEAGATRRAATPRGSSGGIPAVLMKRRNSSTTQSRVRGLPREYPRQGKQAAGAGGRLRLRGKPAALYIIRPRWCRLPSPSSAGIPALIESSGSSSSSGQFGIFRGDPVPIRCLTRV